MRKVFVLASVIVLSVTAIGCGPDPDALMKDQIKAMNDMAEALENDAPESKLEEIGKRTKEINEKIEGLSLSDEEKKKLVERHKDELTKATVRLQAAMMKKMMKSMNKAMGSGFPGMPNPGKLP